MYKKIAVIDGVVLREYYRKLGYVEDYEIGCYQIKYLKDILAEISEKKTMNRLYIGIILRLFYVIMIIFFAIILKYLQEL